MWWWIDRWRKSTAYTDLTLEQQGAYRNLLDEQTLRGGPIPDDERILAKACGDALAWPLVRDAVLARFDLVDGGWINRTCEEVNARSVELSEKRSAAGKRGNEARWGRIANIANSSQTTSQTASQTASPPSPSPSPKDQERTGSRSKLTYDGPMLTVFPWQHKELGKALNAVGRQFDLIGWYPVLEEEIARTKEPLPFEDRERWSWLLDRLYRDAKLPRPNLFGKPRKVVGERIGPPSAEETRRRYLMD